jgi:tripartite-type tricarboxylate transporter receptor subunit TctC
MPFTRRNVIKLISAAPALPFGLAQRPAMAQTWPVPRVRLLVGTSPGGSPDVVGRMLAESLTDRLPSAVYVENLTQAAGAVAYRTLARATPDGGTMGVLTAGYASEVMLRPDPSYDPVSGFTFVSMLCAYPLVYAVPVNSPIKSFQDLLDRAKRNPGKLTYTITGYGSAYHMMTKLIELDFLVDASTSAIPRIKGGQFRVLAVTSPDRFTLLPDAPTVAETLPNVQFMSWLCLAVPAGTPNDLSSRLNADVKETLAAPAFIKHLADLGSVPKPTSPEETRQIVAGEIARWADVIKRADIKVE